MGESSRPPEAALIGELREQPPRLSRRQAALQAGLSPSRWEQVENGYRMFRGARYPERAPAQTLARMAKVVGATPAQLREAGRNDAAGELEHLLANGPYTKRQRIALAPEIKEGTENA